MISKMEKIVAKLSLAAVFQAISIMTNVLKLLIVSHMPLSIALLKAISLRQPI